MDMRLSPTSSVLRMGLLLFFWTLLVNPLSAQIELEVVVNPDPAQPLETLDLELIVTNTGALTVTDLSLEFDWPAELSSLNESAFDGDCPSTSCDPFETAIFEIASLPAGTGTTFSIPARISAATPTGTAVLFDARVFDGTTLVAMSSSVVMVNANPQLDFVMSEDRDPVAPGETVRYTLTFGALSSGSGLPGATLQMPVPAGTTFLSASGGGTLQGSSVVWPMMNLSPGESGEEHAVFQVDVGTSLGAVLLAEATIEDQSPVPNMASQRAATRIQSPQDLIVVVNAGPDTARTGETLDLEFTVGNMGALGHSNVQLSFLYPDQLASISESIFLGDCPSTSCESGERVLFNIGDLSAGETVTFSVPSTVPASIPDGSVARVEARVINALGQLSTSATSFAVGDSRQLNLALAENRDPVAPGESVTYTLTYGLSNSGVGAASSTLKLPLPTGMSFVSASGTGALIGDTVQWDLGPLNPGVGSEQTVTLLVDPGVPLGSGVLVEASFETSVSATSLVRQQATTRVQTPQDLEFTVVAGPDGARPNDILDIELTVTNSGSLAHSNVVLTLEYPDQLAPISETAFDGDCLSTSCEPRETVVFDIGTIPAGEGRTYSIPASIGSSVVEGEVMRLEAELTDSAGTIYETGTNLVIRPSQQLNLAVTDNRDPVLPGEQFTYSITYGTSDPGVGVPDATLILPLPSGTSLVAATGGGVLVGGNVEWSLGGLVPGSSGSLHATVSVDDAVELGSILETEALFLGGGTSGQELRYENATRVETAVPLELTIVANPSPCRQGENLDVELTVGNTSALNRSGVILSLEYPEGLASVSESLFEGDCGSTSCESRERVFFDIGTLPAGQTVTYSVPARVGAVSDGSVIRLEAEVVDSSERRRESGTSVAVRGGRDLDLVLFDSRDAVEPGEVFEYRMVYGALQSGGGSATTELVFDIPEGTSIDRVSDNGQVIGSRVVWDLGALNPGAGGERFVSLLVDPMAPIGSTLTAESQLLGSGLGDVHASAATRIELSPPIDLDISVNPVSALPGTTLDLQMWVTNLTALDRTDVVVWFEFPDGIASLSESAFDGDCLGTSCEPLERAFFAVPILPAGATVVLDAPPVVSATAMDGTVIRFDSRLSDSQGRVSLASTAIVVGDDFDPASGSGSPIFTRGDCNNDGLFDIADPVFVLEALFIGGGPGADCFDACDGNDDGVFDISDAVAMLARLFAPGTAPLPNPSDLACGEDPTPDSLDCAAQPTTACP